MSMLRALLLACLPLPALACETPVCAVDPNTLTLTELITFDDMPSGWDPGYLVDELLSFPGAVFAERFAGQTLGNNGDFDTVTGAAFSPLTPLPGKPGQMFSVVNMSGTNILNGYGPAGFPRVHAQGEGAIAVMFNVDQPALAFQLLGGESGYANVQFLRRDGSVIHDLNVDTSGTVSLGFWRQGGEPDIAGIVITNMDPQGLALDNLRFGPPPQLG